VRALGCPQCGGALEIREGTALVRCSYCAGAFLARARGGTIRFLAPARVAPAIAERTVRELLRAPERPPGLATGATRVATDLFYVPFWRFRATFIGRVRGKRDVFARRPVATAEGDPESGLGALRVEMKEVKVGTEDAVEEIQEIWKASITASPLDDLGVPRLSALRQMPGGLARLAAGSGEIPGLALAGDGPWDGTLIDPMIGPEDARAEADAIFDRFVHGRGAELHERELVYDRLQERESLVFYPVYRVRFQYRGRLFDAAVDGLEGRLVRAVLPGRTLSLRGPFLAAAGALGLVAGTVLRAIAIPSPTLLRLTSAGERRVAVLLARRPSRSGPSGWRTRSAGRGERRTMSSSRHDEPRLQPLSCPACGAALDPLSDDLLFLCAGCGGASELAGSVIVRRELRHRTPSSGPRPVHLPFWRLSADAFTPAFNGSRLLTLTRWYSERLDRIESHAEGPAPLGLWGGRIGAADAPRLLALAWEGGAAGRPPHPPHPPRPTPRSSRSRREGGGAHRQERDDAAARAGPCRSPV
jgi:predicted RNA-binding Zn-ribbon protein involved in translation (DUF1610 family)